MIAHDRHKLTMVNFSEYGRVSDLLVGSLSMESYDRSTSDLDLILGLLHSQSENLANV